MNIVSLTIEKQSNYAAFRPNEMVGKVQLAGDTGKQEVILTTQTLVQIFSVIRNDVIAATKKNAEMTKSAMDEAIHGPLLESSVKVPEIAAA